MELFEEWWKKFSLFKAEEREIVIDEETLLNENWRGDLSLVAKVHTEQILKKEVLQTMMMKLWKTVHSFNINDLGPNLFLICFKCNEDKERVLLGRPWLFDSLIFSLKSFDGRTPLSRMLFNKEGFWVHMHNLPLACMNEKYGKMIGKNKGIV